MEFNKHSGAVSCRPEIRVLDATLRDGGLVNNFFFDDSFVKNLYKTNVAAGVDYMEFGYRADRNLFSPSCFGKWKFCSDDDILSVIGEKDGKIKISVMADVGRCDYKRDIGDKKNSPVDTYRIATYINAMPSAIAMIEYAHSMGYETSCNIMAASAVSEKDMRAALGMLGASSVDLVYIVDSYGAFYPEQIYSVAEEFTEFGEKYSKKIGVHAHNSQNLAFANTIGCFSAGVNYLDATYGGMGRGAGNCAIEQLLAFLKNPGYNLLPVLKFLEENIVPLKKSGVSWGYDVQYLLTGCLNRHPAPAISFTSAGRKDYSSFYQEILDGD